MQNGLKHYDLRTLVNIKPHERMFQGCGYFSPNHEQPCVCGIFGAHTHIILRCYWPQDPIINGQWVPPGVTRVTATPTQPTRNDATTYTIMTPVVISVILLGVGMHMLRRKRQPKNQKAVVTPPSATPNCPNDPRQKRISERSEH